MELSNSEITTWTRCRRKWFLNYYLKKGKPESATGHLQLGTRIHTALEGYYGHGIDPLETIQQLYREAFQEWLAVYPVGDDGVEHPMFNDLRKEGELAYLMIEGYKQWIAEEGVDEGLEIVGTEQKLVVPLTDTVSLKGRIDVRVRRPWDGATMFMDHKTAASLSNDADLLQMDSQFKFYGLLEYLHHINVDPSASRTDGGIRNILKKVKRTTSAKPPFYRRVDVKHNVHELRSMFLKVRAIAEDIEQTRKRLDEAPTAHQFYAYPVPDLDCSWRCPYTSVCVSMDDGSRWQDQLESNYIGHDPYKHYEKSERWEKK